jgi:hypothetical protein
VSTRQVQQLLVDLDCRRREEDHHRAFHPVLVGDEPSRGRVLPGARDRELALALEELQRVARSLRAFLFDDGEDLVSQVRLAHVEERLARHRRVLDALLFRHEGQDGLHQRRLPRGRTRLDHHGERLFQLPRHRGQVAHELVRLLAHHAAAGEVGEDAALQAGIAQQRKRGLALVVVQLDGLLLRLRRLLDLLLLQSFQAEQHLAEVLLHHPLLEAELAGGLGEVGLAMSRRVEVERVHVEALALARHERVHAQRIKARVLRESADAPAAIAERHHELLAALFRRRRLGRRGGLGSGG